MKRQISTGIALLFLLFVMTGVSQAELVKIGQGIHWDGLYGVTTSNLIWDTDTDQNGESMVWLDYSAPQKTWANQMLWASGINTMVVTLDSGYTVEWGTSWRLPNVEYEVIATGSGSMQTFQYNVTDSEMGNLFYNVLHNTEGQLTKTDIFLNLIASSYWSGTDFVYQATTDGPKYDRAWGFGMYDGHTMIGIHQQADEFDGNGLAVRFGKVSTVPVPGAIWLLGSGLIGLVGFKKKILNNISTIFVL